MTSVPNDQDRQNLDGFKYLRRRFIRRARYVASLDAFRDDVRRARLDWNDRYPNYQIRPVGTIEELATSPSIKLEEGMFAGYVPTRLAEDRDDRGRDRDVQEAWYVQYVPMILDICDTYWPPKWFASDGGTTSSPVSRFVSACLFHTTLEVGRAAENFIPAIRLEPRFLNHRPSHQDPLNLIRLKGQVNYLLDFIDRRMGHQLLPDEMLSIKFKMVMAGNEYLYRTGLEPIEPRQEWWYLPITAGISSKDIRAVESQIVEISKDLYGPRQLDNLIVELRRDDPRQWTQEAIANALGVSLDTVKAALASVGLSGAKTLPGETRTENP